MINHDKNKGIRRIIMMNESANQRTRLSSMATPIFITKQGRKIPLNKAIKNLKVKKQTMKVSQNVKALKKAQSLGFSSINKTDYDKIMRSR
tara:strand:- start:10037 stop:10309 length:273 start_codon:yes stop_codon:yes gene_type:complete